jgi:hypothetical protein
MPYDSTTRRIVADDPPSTEHLNRLPGVTVLHLQALDCAVRTDCINDAKVGQPLRREMRHMPQGRAGVERRCQKQAGVNQEALCGLQPLACRYVAQYHREDVSASTLRNRSGIRVSQVAALSSGWLRSYFRPPASRV